MVLFGRSRPILPSVADEEGRCSEVRVWALVHQPTGAVRTYEDCQLDNSLHLSDGDRACLRAFLYCAIRLSVSQPFWLGDMTGTYEDILR